MKKRIICLLAALLLLLGLSVSASAAVYANVIDTAELLSESEAEALDARCSELEQTYGCGVYLVTVDDYTAYYSADSIESFAESVFLDLGLGAGEEQDGVLLVLSMAERDYDICAHGTIGNRAFTDYGKGVLAERWFLEPFSRDDWSGGFAAFLDGCEEYLRMDAEGAPFDQGTDPERLGDLAVVKWLVVIFVPLLTALVVCLVMKGKMKSARLQTQADAYITQDSLRLTRQDDRYITHPDPRQDRDRQVRWHLRQLRRLLPQQRKVLKSKKEPVSIRKQALFIFISARPSFLPPRWCPCCRGRRRRRRTDIP